jgi:hypothetical protein
MEGIEIGKAISEYGIAIVTGIFLVLVCWLVRYLIKEQSKNMKTVLDMFKVELKALHKDGLKNASLNRRSITMIGTLSEYLNKHFNGCTDKLNPKKKINEKGKLNAG